MTFTPLHNPAQQLAVEIGGIISEASKWSPRSQQVYIGPSEVGQECVRRLAYKLLDWDKANESGGGSWAANVGTAIHSFLGIRQMNRVAVLGLPMSAPPSIHFLKVFLARCLIVTRLSRK